jgi:hypothetical protein
MNNNTHPYEIIYEQYHEILESDVSMEKQLIKICQKDEGRMKRTR